MAGNDNERTFAPAEIDVLEDALEQAPTSVLSLPSTLDDDARTRIHDVLLRYRAIERHAQALLRVEPPASVLADVMAQARAAAAMPSAAPAPVDAPAPVETPSFWSRVKALWIVPSLAAVGATALVLVMVTKTSTSEDAVSSSPEASTRVAAAERNAEQKADAKSEAMPPLAQAEGRGKDGTPAEEELQRGAGLVDDVTANDAEKPSEIAETATKLEDTRTEKRKSATLDTPSDPAPSVDPFARGAPEPKPEPKATPTPKAPPKPAKPSSGAGGNVPGGVPTPTTPNAGPKAPKSDQSDKDAPTGQERLSRADAARHRGDCSAARPDYDHVVETGTSKQRARARRDRTLPRASRRQRGCTIPDRSRAARRRTDRRVGRRRTLTRTECLPAHRLDEVTGSTRPGRRCRSRSPRRGRRAP